MYFRLLLVFLLFCGALTAQDKAPKPGKFSVSGGLSASSFFYAVSGGPDRRPPTGYGLNANLTLRAGQFALPFSATLNEQGTNFGNPFNRFGISPTYKWATVHLGHRNLTFSPFVLSGATFFGAGADLRPGKLRLSALYGRFERPRIRRLDGALAADFEFRRTGYSVRAGIGDYRNFVDLIWLKAADGVEGVPVDTTFLGNNFARDNGVIGLNVRREFFGGKLTFTGNGGLSLLTRNRRAPELGVERQELVDRLSFLIKPNVSTSANYAGEAGLQLNLKTIGLGLNYRRVMPDYQSLGVNYLLDDTETITIAPRIRAMKGRLSLSGSLGLQRNNLADQRQAATFRQIGSANLDYQAESGLGLGVSYGNYRLDQQVVIDTILDDSLLLNQINHQVSVTPRWFRSTKTMTHTVVLLASWQELDDRNPGTGDLVDNQVVMLNLTYAGRLKPGEWRLSAGVTAFRLSSALVGNDRYGAHVSLGKQLGKKLTVSGRAAYNRLMRDDDTGYNYSLNGSVRYAFTPKASLDFTGGQLQNDFSDRSFGETRGRLRLGWRF